LFVRKQNVIALTVLMLLLGALAAHAEFVADVSASGTKVTLSVNAVDIVALNYTSTNQAVLTNLANAMTREVRSTSSSIFAAESVKVAKAVLTIKVSANAEYRIPTAEIVSPNVPDNEIAGVIVSRLRQALNYPPFAVVPGRLVIPVGENRTARITGAYGAEVEALNMRPEIINVDVTDTKVIITGLSEGDGEVLLRTGTNETKLYFTVKKLAAYLPDEVELEIAGDTPDRDELRDAMLIQLKASASVAPDAVIQFTELSPSASGNGWEAKVVADSPSCIKVSRSIPITVSRGPNYRDAANAVLFSNDPEQVYEPGVLYNTNLVNGDNARLAFHHQNRSGSKLRFRVLLTNLSSTSQRVFYRAGNAGPDISTYMVGSAAVEKYLRSYGRGQGYYLNISPNATTVVFDRTAGDNYSVSGLIDLHMLTNGEIGVTVVAEKPGASTNIAYIAGNTGGAPGVNYPARYHPAVSMRSESYDLDGNWLFLRIGKGETFDYRGRPLLGDYGMLLEYKVSLVNTAGRSRSVAISFDATAGEARAAFLINNELVRTPIVFARAPYQMKVLTLGPYENREISLITVPAGGSNFPANLIFAALD
jgi:hypothetical protein